MEAIYNKHRHIKERLAIRLRVLMVLVFGVVLLQPVHISLAAGSATMTLNPASGSYAKDASLTVTIHEDSGSSQINAVEADLSYDQAKLQFVSVDVSASAFDLAGPSSGGSGSVKIARAKTGASLTGDQVVAAVNFKALVGSGTTAVTFLDSSGIIQTSPTSDIWNHVLTGGTYTLTGDSTGGGGGGGGGSGQTTPPPSTKPPSNPSGSSSGSSTSPSSATPTAPTTPATVTGYGVAIKVVDDKGKPIEGAEVTLAEATSDSTDNTGIAEFNDVKSGNYSVTVTFKSQKVTQSITVNDSSDLVQTFTVTLPKTGFRITAIEIWSIAGGLVLIILVVLGIMIVRRVRATKRRSNSFNLQDVTVHTNEQPNTNPTPTPYKPPPGTVIGTFESDARRRRWNRFRP